MDGAYTGPHMKHFSRGNIPSDLSPYYGPVATFKSGTASGVFGYPEKVPYSSPARYTYEPFLRDGDYQLIAYCNIASPPKCYWLFGITPGGAAIVNDYGHTGGRLAETVPSKKNSAGSVQMNTCAANIECAGTLTWSTVMNVSIPSGATSTSTNGICKAGGVLPNGATCNFTKPGHTCDGLVCTAGKFSLDGVTCTPNPCKFDDLAYDPFATAPQTGCSAGLSVAHGASCNFTRNGYACESTTCVLGSWIDKNITCSPGPCNFNEAGKTPIYILP